VRVRRHEKENIHISGNKRDTVLILNLILYSLSAIFVVNPAKAENEPILSPELRHVFCPSSVDSNASQDIGRLQTGFSGQPYMAGYMTTDYLSGNLAEWRATGVRVTVSFKGTDNSIIQDGNALAAGIAIQGPSSSGSIIPPISPFIDFGYTMLLTVDNQHDWPYIEGAVWSVYEWGLDNMWPEEPPVVYLEAHFSWEFPYVLTMDSEVTLIMKWNSNPDVLSFSAIIDDYPEYPIYVLIPSDIQLHYFMLGTTEREHPIVSLTGIVKFFQFPGAWSTVDIGQAGWHSYLSHPSFIRTDESFWRNVGFAYSVNGTTSWLDNTVNWGGICYDNVDADYTCQHVHFYPTSNGHVLQPNTLLWDNSPPNAPSTPDGRTWGYKNVQYFYITNTTDPEGDNVMYEFDWGDSSTTTTVWRASGETAGAYHIWQSSSVFYVKAKAKDTYGLWSGWSSYLQVEIVDQPPGGGGCPTLFVWDGKNYVDYGVINIHNPSGEDLVKEVSIQVQDLAICNHLAKLRLREGWSGLNFSESFIDQAKLYAIDNTGNRHLCPLISAQHNLHGNVLLPLLISDNYKLQISLLEKVDLQFIMLYQNTQSFTFVIEGYNPYKV